MFKLSGLAAVAVLTIGGLASPAHAFLNTTNVSTCTTTDCGSVFENAAVLRDPLNGAIPFVAQILAGAGECIRLEVFRQTTDLEMTVAAPNGTVFRDDDGAGAQRPLVEFTAPVAGAYTVTVSHYLGIPVDANFTILYGRYNSGNPNCANPTRPALAASHALKSGGARP